MSHSSTVRKLKIGTGEMIYHWCPACRSLHGIRVSKDGKTRPSWTFNGDFEKPTFSPSILCFTTYDDDGETVLPNGQRRTLCHYFIKDGKIEFCGDNPHSLNGKTVDLPDLPHGYAEGEA